jgi:hypothetical protein
MTFSLQSISAGKTPTPPRIIIYGGHKMGKSTFAAGAPKPIFIQTEDGLDNIDAHKFPQAKSYDDVVAQMKVLAEEPHDYQTLVIDSLDWLEPLIWQKLLQDRPNDEKGRKVEDIVDYGFGKGYQHAVEYWLSLLAGMDYLRSAKGMMVLLLAHEQIKRFDDPEADPYDRYQIKLHQAASDKLQEKADAIFFISQKKAVKEKDVGFNKKVARAVDAGRFIYTQESAAFDAGNRYSLPAQIPLTEDGSAWNTLVEHIPYLSNKYLNKGE